MYNYDVYQQHLIDAREVFDVFDRLYAICNRRIDFIRCNTRIRTPDGDYPGLPWNTQPGKKWERPNRAWIIRGIIADLAAADLNFAWGISTRGCRTSPALQLEWDFNDATQPINEVFLTSVINDECLEFLKSRGINPHFIFTGGRSIHVAFYCARHIPNKTWWELVRMLKASLFAGGKPDANSLYSGMRLPLSIHQKTGTLCRYAGTYTSTEVIAYASHVTQDNVLSRDMRRAVTEWFAAHSDLKPWQLTSVTDPKPVAVPLTRESSEDEWVDLSLLSPNESPEVLTSDATVPDFRRKHLLTHTLPPTSHLGIVSGKGFGDLDQPLIETSHARNHARREEYQSYLTQGIPRERAWNIIRNTDFVFWALHKLNSKQRVWDALVVSLRVDAPDDVYEERLKTLRWMLDHTAYTYTHQQGKHSHVPLTEEEGAWLLGLPAAMKGKFRAPKIRGLVGVACYVLQKLRIFGEANIGVEEVATFLADGGSKPIRKASEYLRVFQRGEFKLMEIVQKYKKPKAGQPGVTRKFRRVAQLPPLAVGIPVQEAPENPSRSPQESETIQEAA